MQKLLFTLLSLLFLNTYAQEYNGTELPNTFQHPDNPHYWKNNKPFTDYWQQDVSYKMDIIVDEKTDILHGKETLTYWNNSPDTLFYVYFHLYSNQAVKNSYLDKLTKAKGGSTRFGKYQEKEIGLDILSMQTEGKELKTEVDNTILKVFLEKPLVPNSQITFDIIFKNYYDNGSIRRRMKTYTTWGKKHYNGAHWYPRIAVYDRKFGWTTDQHLGREFYGDFGTYDITLNFANDFIVTATGNLLNREEMYPEELWEKLKIENFKDKPWNEKPSTIIERDSTRKSWHFYAENIPDFAFVADPHFRIGVAEWNGKKAYSFAQEPHASKWQNAAEYTSRILSVFSKDFGMYGWHKMIVADARSGMEYPMLTMDNGSDPGYRGLLVHEVGHNWFFGMMNNNETYRPFMDEGFTQFLTAWGLEALDGKYIPRNEPKNWYLKKFSKPTLTRESKVFFGYLRDATNKRDPQLNTHSDAFYNSLGEVDGYGHAYYKTAAMLYNLQYTLGDTLFQNAMKHYFDKWSFKHPYPIDFRTSIIEYAHTDLNWFFDQWLETNKTIDYKISSISVNDTVENGYNITFKRKGRMQMPIDFQVVDKAGEKYDFHIPNNYFVKKTDAKVLAKWTGWDKLNEEYTATIKLPKTDNKKVGNIKNVIIDPTDRLADANMLNNRLKGNVVWKFDSHVRDYPNRKKYVVKWRPDLWWNSIDGFKLGLNLRGNYMKRKHFFSLLVGYNTEFLSLLSYYSYNNSNKIYYRFNYSTPLDEIIPFSNFSFHSRFIDGLALNKIKVSKRLKNNTRISLAFKSMIRPNSNDNLYLLNGDWDTQKWNNKIILGLTHYFRYNKNKARGVINANILSSVFSDYNDFAMKFEFKGTEKLWKFDFKSRVFAQYRPANMGAKESALYLASANSEEMMENKYVRSRGLVGGLFGGTRHFQYGGGLNLRGFSGDYARYNTDDSNPLNSSIYRGNSGLSLNLELGFDRLIKLKKISKFFRNFDFDMYLFGDVGLMTYSDYNNIERLLLPRADAGIGTTFTLKKFGKLSGVKPIVIRFDMPLYVSHTSITENNFKFRWVIGINRAF